MKNKIILVFIIVIIVGFVIPILIPKDKINLTFGLISGLSGDYAAVGESFAKGAELAQEEWNKENPDSELRWC